VFPKHSGLCFSGVKRYTHVSSPVGVVFSNSFPSSLSCWRCEKQSRTSISAQCNQTLLLNVSWIRGSRVYHGQCWVQFWCKIPLQCLCLCVCVRAFARARACLVYVTLLSSHKLYLWQYYGCHAILLHQIFAFLDAAAIHDKWLLQVPSRSTART
jgi:hypothetical protein